MERVIGEFKNDGLLHLQFWEDEYNHNISDFAVPEVDAKKLYYELRDYFKQRVETAIHKKEEKAKECVEKVFNERYNMHLDSYDLRKAFNIGWDSSIENIECIAKWNDAKRTLPEFNEDNNAVICIADDNCVSLQRGKLADKTKLWCWLSDILPVAIL